MQNTSKEKLNLNMLNYTCVFACRALLVDRCCPNAKHPGAKHGGAFSFGKAHVRHARKGRWVKSDTREI